MGLVSVRGDLPKGHGKKVSAIRDFPPGFRRRVLAKRSFPPGCGRRRISATRDFPPDCGRNAPHVSKEEHLKAASSSKDKSIANKISSGEQRPFNETVRTASESKLKLEDTKEARVGHKHRSLEGRVKKDRVGHKHNEEKSSKRKFPGESKDENDAINQSQREQSVGLDPSDDKVLLKALTAAPNCPRRQGEQSRKSKLTSGTTRHNVKKHGLILPDKSKVGKERVEHGNEKSSKRKFPGESDDENGPINQSRREKLIGLDPFDDRVFVQALMAAPNCPWRKGKRRANPTSGTN